VTLPPYLKVTSATYEISNLAEAVSPPSGTVGWSINYSRSGWMLTYAPDGTSNATGSLGNIYPAVTPDDYTFDVGAVYEAEFDWVLTLEVVPVPPLVVAIDIKPGSDPNSINPKSNGVIPVAILGSESFDATTVDASTVTFGPGEASPTHRKGHVEDVNGDGYADLLVHFKTSESGIGRGDTSATLTGKTTDGEPIQGSDSVRTVGH
jgi:hypothetical protein